MVRLAGIETPEILGKCEKEKKLAGDANCDGEEYWCGHLRIIGPGRWGYHWP